MIRFFTLLLAASCLTAVGQVPDYVPTDGLVGWWPLGEIPSDQSGNQLDGELIETVHTDGVNGLVNSATYFNGENSCYVVEGPIPLQGDFTFSFWIRSIIGITDFNPIMILNGGSGCSINSNLEVYLGNGGLTVSSNRGTDDFSFYYYNEISHLEWTHIALKLTGTQMALYTNGILSQIGTIQPFVGEPQPMRIGHFNSAAFDGCDIFFEGSIDDVGFWDEALSGEQIQELFLAPAYGCTNEVACNFAPSANEDDGGCEFVSCHCLEGTVWSAELGGCIVANPSDSNFDGCVQLNDLLDLLTAYGDCAAEESPWQCGDPLEYQGYDYETVQIGDQCWFAENLRAENYRNNDPIPTDISACWDYDAASLFYGEGELCENYSPTINACNFWESEEEYGRLYNFSVVSDPRGCCPSDWHVPDNFEWQDLIQELGGGSTAAAKMRAVGGWFEDGNGSNYSGFNAKPSGYLHGYNCRFKAAGTDGFWWSLTLPECCPLYASYARITSSIVETSFWHQTNGYSVRCIKDAE